MYWCSDYKKQIRLECDVPKKQIFSCLSEQNHRHTKSDSQRVILEEPRAFWLWLQEFLCKVPLHPASKRSGKGQLFSSHRFKWPDGLFSLSKAEENYANYARRFKFHPNSLVKQDFCPQNKQKMGYKYFLQ